MAGELTDEVILAEEQAVINRGVGVVKEVEAAFDVGEETEGTLILTNRRLIYAHGAELQDDLPIGEPTPYQLGQKKRLIYSDVEDLESMASDPANFSIPLDSVVSVTGHKGVMAPKIEVRWNEGGTVKATEFVQQITGRSRKKNLNDWAQVIDRLKSGQQRVIPLPPLPPRNSLDSRILFVLGDMQEKGLFTIEREVEQKFSTELDPDDVDHTCEKLVSQGFVKKSGGPGEDPFYQKISPLGEDDLNL